MIEFEIVVVIIIINYKKKEKNIFDYSSILKEVGQGTEVIFICMWFRQNMVFVLRIRLIFYI